MLIELSDLDSSESCVQETHDDSTAPTTAPLPEPFDVENFLFGSDSGGIELDDLSVPHLAIPEKEMFSCSDTDEDTESSPTAPHLTCCPNEPLPKLVLCAHSKLYHASCFNCSICKNQIKPPGCFATVARQHRETVLCTECAERLETKKKLCKVCHRDIDNVKCAVQLKPGYFVHPACLHCACCSRTPGVAKTFSICEGQDKDYVLCSDCISVMNGNGTPDHVDSFVGRFIKDILPATFIDRCQRCRCKFKNLGFVFHQQMILCVECGFQYLN